VTSVASDGSTAQITLTGTGFVDGNKSSYQFGSATIQDAGGNQATDVFSNGTSANLTVPLSAGAIGPVTVTTPGGISAPISTTLTLTLANATAANDGYLRDLAMDPSNPGQLWVADNGNPAKLHLINTATGADIRAITLATGGGASTDFGSTAFFGGMQIAPATFSLNGTSVPAGSLLLFDGQTNADRVIAVDPSSGLILATLVLTKNYDLTGGVYDPSSGHLYIVDRSVGPNQIVPLNPADGTEIANSRFNLPVNAGEAGLALDPGGDGTFWYGSDQSNHVWHLAANGAVLKDDDLTGQGVTHNEINGLSFDNAGRLLVASALGVVYRVTV